LIQKESVSVVKLAPSPVLGGYDRSFGDTRLTELSGVALVSVALPLGDEKAAEKAIKSAYQLAFPDSGASTATQTHRLIRTGADQGLLMFESDAANAEPEVQAALKGACYTSLQTDAWVVLSLSGPLANAVLERLCPIDLHDSRFPVDSAARTVMEHMSAIVLRDGADSYQLLSASSSAGSFLHAVETSLSYVS